MVNLPILLLLTQLALLSGSSCQAGDVFWEKRRDTLKMIHKFSNSSSFGPKSSSATLAIYDYKGEKLFAKIFTHSNFDQNQVIREAEMVRYFRKLANVVSLRYCVIEPTHATLFFPYLGLDLVNGIQAFSRKPLLERLGMLHALTLTYHEVHRKSFMQGDIKPDNIVLSETGTSLYSIDYGFTVPLGSEVVGYTLRFSPPEDTKKSEIVVATTKRDSWSWLISLAQILCTDTWSEVDAFSIKNKTATPYLTKEGISILNKGLDRLSKESGLPFNRMLGSGLRTHPEYRPEMWDISVALGFLYHLRLWKTSPQLPIVASLATKAHDGTPNHTQTRPVVFSK